MKEASKPVLYDVDGQVDGQQERAAEGRVASQRPRYTSWREAVGACGTRVRPPSRRR